MSESHELYETPRRRFNHLYEELSVASGSLLPRFRLWMAVSEFGFDPERLSGDDAITFVDFRAQAWAREVGHSLSNRTIRAIRKRVGRYDPHRLTPAEKWPSWA